MLAHFPLFLLLKIVKIYFKAIIAANRTNIVVEGQIDTTGASMVKILIIGGDDYRKVVRRMHDSDLHY